jgi:hypothetical protein
MGTTLADRYATPEEAIVALRHQRTGRLILVILGIIAALGVLLGASALMYSGDARLPSTSAQTK